MEAQALPQQRSDFALYSTPLTGSLRASKMQRPARSLPKARAFISLVYTVKAARNIR